MKIYSKIVGIILTLAGIGAFIVIIIAIIETEYVENKIAASLLFIPCIIFLHFMYIHNFGLNLKSEIPKKNYRVILVLTIISLISSIIVPGGYLFSQINIENNAKEMIDRGKDVSPSSELIANLKTKYDGTMLYVLNIVTPKRTELSPNFEAFFIELKDKDGFNIQTIEIKDYTNLVEENKKYGITSNTEYYISLSDYLKIADWNLLYRRKN
ncbi:hypothetical protein [Flavivirga spongiicola]|uniref:DUF5671 domain-containing protein n=1 Tax=Flavivirga spongiicola TaxID=421621 RepID=A0ABU7XTW5_9FLAO|nr:hypothetical protein [Flavivirga sp. MEBiC05379]MDO5978947.1 hypothetical protein [Flavivirga sp. MEBiC05379]